MRISPLPGIGRHLSDGSTRFVTRRSLLLVAIAAALVASMVSLAVGAALGMRLAERKAAPPSTTERIERSYMTQELGRLDASLTQMAPRIGRLAERIDTLQEIQSRLKGALPARTGASRGNEADAAPMDRGGAGGPSLPPRACAGRDSGTAAEADSTRRRLGCMARTLELLEDEATAYDVALSALPGRIPVDSGRFGSAFGNRRDPLNGRLSFHSGIDLPAASGTPILATAGGRVSFSGNKPGYGQVIEIDHGNQLVSRYGHASKLFVREGELVLPRQHIADVGSTGRSTGPHLHFEVLRKGEAIDPAAFLDVFAGLADG